MQTQKNANRSNRMQFMLFVLMIVGLVLIFKYVPYLANDSTTAPPSENAQVVDVDTLTTIKQVVSVVGIDTCTCRTTVYGLINETIQKMPVKLIRLAHGTPLAAGDRVYIHKALYVSSRGEYFVHPEYWSIVADTTGSDTSNHIFD